MKKLMIAAAIVCAAAFAQAASIDWMMMSYDNVPGISGGDYTGTATLSCAALGWSTDVEVVDGAFLWSGTITSELDTAYEFTISATATSGGDLWVYSGTGSGSTDAFGTGMAGFDAGTWTSVPEPTSAMLMLLGMAGLALKRRRA